MVIFFSSSSPPKTALPLLSQLGNIGPAAAAAEFTVVLPQAASTGAAAAAAAATVTAYGCSCPHLDRVSQGTLVARGSCW